LEFLKIIEIENSKRKKATPKESKAIEKKSLKRLRSSRGIRKKRKRRSEK
jgi:DNA mismatch repair protein MutS2